MNQITIAQSNTEADKTLVDVISTAKATVRTSPERLKIRRAGFLASIENFQAEIDKIDLLLKDIYAAISAK